MSNNPSTEFLAGVIEGFYGPPWTLPERLNLFDWMTAWGLNTYLYAPKDDLKQRALWRETYADAEADVLKSVIQACQQRHLRFIYALSPGLDLSYSKESDLDLLRKRFQQMLDLGCQHFALLFDDIPDQLDPADIQRWGSLAAAQAHVANAMFHWVRQRSATARFLFCPTPYCGWMAARKLGGDGYLAAIGRDLFAEIDVFWTGPDIISETIPVGHVQELRTVLRRKPLIWDNLHANDYDGRRFYCGPYAGREPALRNEVAGLLTNPNNEFPLNYIPLRTLAGFVQSAGPWEPRQAYLAAMREWQAQFTTIGQPLSVDDLVLLGDCYYLPHEQGPEAVALYELIREVLGQEPRVWGGQAEILQNRVRRLRDFCGRLAELRQRPLFYALSRRIWELREELDLLDRYLQTKSDHEHPETPARSDFHLPKTYRGGMVPQLQRLLVQHPDGTFTPAAAGARGDRSTRRSGP